MFTDEMSLQLFAGRGGNGIVSWRREKYLPKGGPAGGNGGEGGSVIFEVDAQLPSLELYRNQMRLQAENGKPGGSSNCSGSSGADLIVKVPCGTLIKESGSQQLLCDLVEDRQRWLACRGGKGGKGNAFFKSSVNRTPAYATPGFPGEHQKVDLELKLIADVGLVGLPNAGKSTLMNRLTKAAVKVAPYPFTTLAPNLGYTEGSSRERVLLADIPGLIAGAHRNKGLGLQFLRHIERTRLLLFVIDASAEDPHQQLSILKCELESYNPELLKKKSAIVFNKADLLSQRQIDKLQEEDAFLISAQEGMKIESLQNYLQGVLCDR